MGISAVFRRKGRRYLRRRWVISSLVAMRASAPAIMSPAPSLEGSVDVPTVCIPSTVGTPGARAFMARGSALIQAGDGG